MSTPTVTSFGHLSDGRETKVFTLTNNSGMSARVSDYGATLVSFLAPDRKGALGDIVLGFDDVRSYERNGAYMGATVGRFANRIADGKFTIDGQSYELAVNNGPNHLHGGVEGFSYRIWDAEILDGSEIGSSAIDSSEIDSPASAVRFSLQSPDGDENYPGNLDISVTYRLLENGQLHIDVAAKTDATTPISITNHSYFNLAGAGPIAGHWLKVPSTHYTPLSDKQVPTGELAPVTDTPFDFQTFRQIGERIEDTHPQLDIGSGYDHNFMTQANGTEPVLAACAEHRESGRTLALYTNAPGVQLYTANFIGGSGKGVAHTARHAFCLEPQAIPDAPNQSVFPSCFITPDEPYQHTMIFEAGVLP